MLACTERQLVRTYPRGTRFDSANYPAMTMWQCGVQMVALNFQYPGTYICTYLHTYIHMYCIASHRVELIIASKRPLIYRFMWSSPSSVTAMR